MIKASLKFNQALTVSATSLALFNECPRCFYLQVKEKIKRPQGIPMPLYTKMDLLVKDYFDKYRRIKKLPPQIVGKVEGELFDNFGILNQWRNWRTGLRFYDKQIGVQIVSALDDCLVTDDGFFIPLDYKSKAAIKDDSHIFHQNQLNIYTWLLDENGYPTKNAAYLVYFAPTKINDNSTVSFDIVPQKIETSKEKAKKLYYDAAMLLHGTIPPRHQKCEYCTWAMDVHDII